MTNTARSQKTWAQLIRPPKVYNIPAELRVGKIPDKPVASKSRRRRLPTPPKR